MALAGDGGDQRPSRSRTRRGETSKIEKSSSDPELSLSECETVPTPANFHSRQPSPSGTSNPDQKNDNNNVNNINNHTSITNGSSSSSSSSSPSASSAKHQTPSLPQSASNAAIPNKETETNDRAPVTGSSRLSAAKRPTTRRQKPEVKKEPKKQKEGKDTKETKDTKEIKESRPRRQRNNAAATTSTTTKNNNSNSNNSNNNNTTTNNTSNTNTAEQDVSANSSSMVSRKRPKLEPPQSSDNKSLPVNQAKITDLVNASTASPQPQAPSHRTQNTNTSSTTRAQPLSQPPSQSQFQVSSISPQLHSRSQVFYHNFSIRPSPSSGAQSPTIPPSQAPSQVPSPAPPPPQRSSGQNYDPIRSVIDNPSPAPPPSASNHSGPVHPPYSQNNHQGQLSFSPPAHTATPSPRQALRASASPAINSIIDPPAKYPSAPLPLNSKPPSPQSHPVNNNNNNSKAPSLAAPPSTVSNARPQTNEKPQSSSTLLQEPVAMEIDGGNNSTLAVPAPSKPQGNTTAKKGSGASNDPHSRAPSPKPGRAKDAPPPPLPSGSGLLSGTLFGADAANSSTSDPTGPNIILHIPLKGQTNKVINFARMAEEQYGFEAMHPRLAAHRARLARVSAASAALERNERNGKGDSAMEDDLTVDVDRDSDADGDVAMTGMGGGTGAAASTEGQKKRRRKKIEEYDREDPFVDDSELAWQEHAAASKDGFFVYSGPLVPEGEKVSVEKADGPPKRSRARGARSGNTAGQTSTGQSSRAGRGGATNSNNSGNAQNNQPAQPQEKRKYTMRKPRMTKAERELAQQEKKQREEATMGTSAKPGTAIGATTGA